MQKFSLIKYVSIQKLSVKNSLQILSKAFPNCSDYSNFINEHTEIKEIVSHKGFVFRIYPTSEQKNFIHQNIGCRRKIYNIYVDFLYKYLEKILMQERIIKEIIRNTGFYIESIQDKFNHPESLKEQGFKEDLLSFYQKNSFTNSIFDAISVDYVKNIEYNMGVNSLNENKIEIKFLGIPIKTISKISKTVYNIV